MKRVPPERNLQKVLRYWGTIHWIRVVPLLLLSCFFNLIAWTVPEEEGSETVFPSYSTSAEVPVALKVSRHDRAWKCLRKSDELCLNPARKELLQNLLLGQADKAHNLMDEAVWKAIHRHKALPPGLQKQLIKGREIPTSLVKHMVILPLEVSEYLGFTKHPEVRIGVLGDDIILYTSENNVIHDILRGLF